MQNRLPLNEASGRRGHFRIFLQINFFPRTPVSVGIVHVPGAREQFNAALAAKLGASPLRENVGVKNIALIAAFGLGRAAQKKNFTEIAGRGIKATAGGLGESSHLIGAGFDQLGVILAARDLEYLAVVPGAG